MWLSKSAAGYENGLGTECAEALGVDRMGWAEGAVERYEFEDVPTAGTLLSEVGRRKSNIFEGFSWCRRFGGRRSTQRAWSRSAPLHFQVTMDRTLALAMSALASAEGQAGCNFDRPDGTRVPRMLEHFVSTGGSTHGCILARGCEKEAIGRSRK